MYDVMHGLICWIVPVHVVVRAIQIRRLKKQDRRIFGLFWIWPLIFIAQRSLVPFWQTNIPLADAASLCIALACLIDFCYYFLLESKARSRLRLLFLIMPAVLVVIFWFGLTPSSGQSCVLPHSGRYMVWTDPLFRPDTFYFMRQERGQVFHPDTGRDPNFGRAIFAPFSGQVLAVDGSFIEVQGQQALVEIGPFLPETIRVKPGQTVFVDQPLGLTGRVEGQPPGVRLRQIAGEALVFQEFFGGRWLGFRYQQWQPRRNWYVQSDSETRFRVDPETRESR